MEQSASQNTHQPFLWEAEGSDTAVLMVHGILGSPNQFEGIAQRLVQEGFSVMAILLPGHGGSARDFAKAKPKDWQQTVHEAAALLRQRYRHIFLLGHSMGGLLIIGEAIQCGADGLILISVPMRVKIGFKSMFISMKILWGDSARDDEKMRTYRRSFSIAAGPLWQRLRWISTYGGLLQLIKNTRRSLEQVRQPVLIIQSRRDETVWWQSAEILRRGLGNAPAVDVLLLDRSAHSYHHPDEIGALYSKICDFVKGRIK